MTKCKCKCTVLRMSFYKTKPIHEMTCTKIRDKTRFLLIQHGTQHFIFQHGTISYYKGRVAALVRPDVGGGMCACHGSLQWTGASSMANHPQKVTRPRLLASVVANHISCVLLYVDYLFSWISLWMILHFPLVLFI